MNFLLKTFAIFLCFICLLSAESFGAEQLFNQDNAPTAIPVLSPDEAVIANNEALSYFSSIISIAQNSTFHDEEITPVAIPVLSPDEALKINKIAINLYKKEMAKEKIKHFMLEIGLNKNRISLLVLLLPMLLFSDLLFKRNRRNNKKRFSIQRRLFVLSAVSLLMVGLSVFVPWSVYFGNISQFPFIFQDFVNSNLVFLSIAIIVFTVLLLIIPPAVSDYLVSSIVGLGLCVYCQSMFMNCFIAGNGTEPIWSQHTFWGVINLCIWLGLVIAPIIINKRFRLYGQIILIWTCGIILFLEISASVFMVFSAPEKVWKRNDSFFCNGSNMFRLSKEKNIIVLIFDQLGSGLTEACFEIDPQYKKVLKDFTWYKDARAAYNFTFPGMLHELTGVYVQNGVNQKDVFQKTWRSSTTESFYHHLKEAGYETNMFIPAPLDVGPAENFADYFFNFYQEKINYLIDREELNHCLVRISTFSSLPYIFKRFFYYPDDFSQDVVCQQIESNPFLEVVPIRNDRFYKKMIKEMGTDTAKSSVIAFYYTLGAHVSWNVDEKCQYHAPPFNSILPPGRSCLFLLSEMVRLLKEKNLYDQTAIIVCSDHNARVEEYSDYFDMTLMVKPFNANNNEMICDYSRASSIDIVPTVYQFACGNNQDFKSFEGFPLSSIPEDRMRKVFNLTMHPSLPPFEDIDGNPHPYNNCLREHNFDDLATFDWKTTFVRYIPWNSSVDIDESILTRYSFR